MVGQCVLPVKLSVLQISISDHLSTSFSTSFRLRIIYMLHPTSESGGECAAILLPSTSEASSYKAYWPRILWPLSSLRMRHIIHCYTDALLGMRSGPEGMFTIRPVWIVWHGKLIWPNLFSSVGHLEEIQHCLLQLLHLPVGSQARSSDGVQKLDTYADLTHGSTEMMCE